MIWFSNSFPERIVFVNRGLTVQIIIINEIIITYYAIAEGL